MKVLHIGRAFKPFLINGLLEYAEDLMDIQVAQGYEVAYFFSGRHYPGFRKPWLRKWLKQNIKMYEIINSPIVHGQGTLYPEADLTEEYSEKFFLKTLAEFSPDIIHIQDLYGLPSSLIDIIKSNNIPVLMTLHDYFLLCPTSKLFDYQHSRCLSQYVGDRCVICCAQAPHNANHLIKSSLKFEVNKFLPVAITNYFKYIKENIKKLLSSDQKKPSFYKAVPHKFNYSYKEKNKLESIFQERRKLNIERLNKIDLLISQSYRTSEIYQTLGIKSHNVTTIHSIPIHINYIKPKIIENVLYPINFTTANSFSSVEKGSCLILETLHILKQRGLDSKFRLFVTGNVLDSTKNELLQFDNVVCKGFYNVNDLNHLLEGMHVGIVPSVWEEVYGYVGVEFLAKGIPIIGNSLGGIVDYTISNVTGWLNTANTAEGLAQIMTDIIDNPNQILELNKKVITNYNQIIKQMNINFEEMDKIYRNVINKAENTVQSTSN